MYASPQLPDGAGDRDGYVVCVLEQLHRALARRDVFVDGLGRNGLVEVLGLAAAGVMTGNRVSVRHTGGDAGAHRLEQSVSSDVVGVPVRVHDQR